MTFNNSTMSRTPAILLALAAYSVCYFCMPAATASVDGTFSAATDWAISMAQAGLALAIIACCFMVWRGAGILPVIGIVAAMAGIISARDIAGIFQ